MGDQAFLTIPGPWLAEPDEFTWSGEKWPNCRWKVTGASLVPGGRRQLVAGHLSEDDAKLIASCKPAQADVSREREVQRAD